MRGLRRCALRCEGSALVCWLVDLLGWGGGGAEGWCLFLVGLAWAYDSYFVYFSSINSTGYPYSALQIYFNTFSSVLQYLFSERIHHPSTSEKNRT